jgi:hypothetical protein
MEIESCTLSDLDMIMALYREATAYQKTKSTSHWPEFDSEKIKKEIINGQHWKMLSDEKVICIWAHTFSDPSIWGERNSDPAIYLHRICINPDSRGKKLVNQVIEWAKRYASQNEKMFVRLDTAGENQGLIKHYTGCGLTYLGLVYLRTPEDLPSHYHNTNISLFEMKLEDQRS